MNSFPKRRYHSLAEFSRDVLAILRARAPLARGTISPAFRERLMLAVTSVNACRYCARFHSQVALAADLPAAEIAQLLAGEFTGAPANEIPALVYAQHWAEMNAQPEPALHTQFIAAYGAETARAIELVLRMIRIGNLAGNTFDYILYRLSFGRLGLPRPQPAA